MGKTTNTNNYMEKKVYSMPNFELVRFDESKKVFFAVSGPSPSQQVGGTLGSLTVSNVSSW